MMEQTTDLPAYMYIPKPIEQQLATYELGTLMEVYKWGWRKDGSVKLTALMVIVGALAIGILSSAGIIAAWQSAHVLVI